MLRIGHLLCDGRRGFAGSSVVSVRKMSSRLMRIGRSSSRPQPRATMARGQLAAHVAPLSLSTSKATTPPRAVGAVTRGDAGDALAAPPRHSAPCAVDLHDTSSRRRAAARVRLSGVSIGDDLALVDDHDALAGLRDLGQDVRAQDDRVVAGELADQLARLDDLLGVEAGGRLVEHQHFGVVDDRLRQADALPVALRELARSGGWPCRRPTSAS